MPKGNSNGSNRLIMKLTPILVTAILQATSVLSAATGDIAATDPSPLTLAEECGDLGVMEIPTGADPTLYRHCESHPLGPNRRIYTNTDLLDPDTVPIPDPAALKGADIFGRAAQACTWDASIGCTNGYCWKKCGNPGQWCWTAYNKGTGDWARCQRATDCNSKESCGKNCKKGNKDCGCSC